MYKAIEIAYWFLYRNYTERMEKTAANDEFDVYEGLTHLKLQKLLYNAQGVSLALRDKPIFEEPLEAWLHGPVVRNVYDTFLVFRGAPIIVPVTEETTRIVEKIDGDSSAHEVLEFVYENFSIYTAWQLREMSHAKNGPWYKTSANSTIDNELIKEYFKKEVVEE